MAVPQLKLNETSLMNVSETRTFSVSRREDAPEAPLVSVVVPVFNASSTLEEALCSLTGQTLQDIEIVCVNDASNDASPEVLQRFFVQDAHFTIVNHAENAGYGASMNDGIQTARGTWIAILEPDDFVLPDMYERMLDFANAFANVDIVKTPYVRELRAEGVARGGEALTTLNCSYRGRIKPAQQPFTMHDAHTDHLLRHHPSIWSALYRKSFLKENDIRFVEYPGAGWADNEFFFETLLAATRIIYLDEPFYVYREETANEATGFLRTNKRLPFDRWHAMDEIVRRHGFGSDTNVRLAHTAKGFTYLGNQLAANTDEKGNTDEEVLDEIGRMFDAMDPALVAREASIPPHLKEMFIGYRGKEDAADISTSKLPYYASLLSELAYTLRNNGLGYTLDTIKRTLRK